MLVCKVRSDGDNDTAVHVTYIFLLVKPLELVKLTTKSLLHWLTTLVLDDNVN